MKIWFSPYELVPIGSLGVHASGKTRTGSLVMFEFDDNLVGYGDVFPWPELGDVTLKEQLSKLSDWAQNQENHALTSLLQQTIAMARDDASARMQGTSLFSNLEIPKSHALITDLSGLSRTQLANLRNRGFTHIKIKMGKTPRQDLDHLTRLAPSLRDLEISLRLDFNASMKPEAFSLFINEMTNDAKTALQFIEDPMPYRGDDWQRLNKAHNVCFALDREFKENQKQRGYDYLVIKPAVQNYQAPLSQSDSSTKIVITSYLGHCVGQLHAAVHAGMLNKALPDRLDICGLLSHKAYEPTAYADNFPAIGNKITGAIGLGIGFDHLLSKEPWRPLE